MKRPSSALAERDDPERVGVARMGHHREPEVGRQVAGDLLPRRRPVVRAIDAAVVALVERLRLAGGHRELVDALAGLREAVLRVELGADADVARLPRLAAVARLEDADGRDPDPRPVGVGRVGDDRVQDQPAGARPPGRSRRVVGQALDMPPGRAAVVAAEEAGRFDAGEQPAIGRRREAPDRSSSARRRRRRSARPTNASRSRRRPRSARPPARTRRSRRRPGARRSRARR